MSEPPHASLNDWLDWQQRLNAAEIDLGLDRVRAVGDRLGVLCPGVPVIIVAGTNGKGSVIAYLESVLNAAGYRAGAYTSPHILRYNERVRIGGREAADVELIEAFERVENARGDIALTYFEFATLAALVVFERSGVEVLLLEVGLGGRLDAVNAVDPDVSVITSIGLDHADWLGASLEAVAREKAGIMRSGVPVVFGAAGMPAVLDQRADALGAPVLKPDRDFRLQQADAHWRLLQGDAVLDDLPIPALAGGHQLDNAAAAVVALRSAGRRLSVSDEAIRNGLAQVWLPGRCQRLPGEVEWLLDAAHNADAAAALAAYLHDLQPQAGRRWAVLGAMRRKDPHALVAPFAGLFDGWFALGLPQPDAWSAADLASAIGEADPGARVVADGDGARLLASVDANAASGDRVVAFGSFHTVELVLARQQTGAFS